MEYYNCHIRGEEVEEEEGGSELERRSQIVLTIAFLQVEHSSEYVQQLAESLPHPHNIA